MQALLPKSHSITVTISLSPAVYHFVLQFYNHFKGPLYFPHVSGGVFAKKSELLRIMPNTSLKASQQFLLAPHHHHPCYTLLNKSYLSHTFPNWEVSDLVLWRPVSNIDFLYRQQPYSPTCVEWRFICRVKQWNLGARNASSLFHMASFRMAHAVAHPTQWHSVYRYQTT